MRAVVRTCDPVLARPREFVRNLWDDFRRSRPLAAEMARRDIRSQYRASMLGAAIVVLTPLAMTAVAVGFRRTGILAVDSAAVPYGLFVLVGVVLWTTFLDAMNAPIFGLLAEARLLARTSAAPEAIVLGKLGPVFFNALVRTALVAAALVWYGATLPATVVLAPVGALALIALGTAIGLALAPVNLVYRDTSKILATFTTVWFFFSPVYFPAPAEGPLGALMRLNPVTPLLSDTRALILTGIVAEPGPSLVVALATAVALAVCWIYVRIALRVAVEQVNE